MRDSKRDIVYWVKPTELVPIQTEQHCDKPVAGGDYDPAEGRLYRCVVTPSIPKSLMQKYYSSGFAEVNGVVKKACLGDFCGLCVQM